MSDHQLSKFFETQISLTEWLEQIGYADIKAMRVEDNYKRDRLEQIANFIEFPFDKPTTFEAQEVTDRTPAFKEFLRDHGEELCALRLIPKKGVHAEKLRNRGKSINEVMGWYDAQKIEPKNYLADFVPHTEHDLWAIIFVVNEQGIFGEIVSGGHDVLTQGFYRGATTMSFSYDFKTWQIEPMDTDALNYLKKLTNYIKVSDLKIQHDLTREVSAEFAHNYMKGYFEATCAEGVGTWFKDYNRILGKSYEDFIFSNQALTGGLQGRVASAGAAEVSGIVKIVDKTDGVTLQPDEILVCSMTSPDYLPLMMQAKAVVTDQGGILCHAAIVARELKKPCIVGTLKATMTLKNGDHIVLNLTDGTIRNDR